MIGQKVGAADDLYLYAIFVNQRISRDFLKAGNIEVEECVEFLSLSRGQVLCGESVDGEVRNLEVEDPAHDILESLLTGGMAGLGID